MLTRGVFVSYLTMGSNPAFLLVKEGYVVLVQRLFDAFRWLYTESGEIEIEGSLDVSSLRAMDCFSVENEGLFENQSILFNLPWMLLPEKWTADLLAHYNLAAVAVESSAKGYWVKVQSESNDSIDLQTLWNEFFKACKREAAIDDVFDNYYVPAFNIAVEILFDFKFAA